MLNKQQKQVLVEKLTEKFKKQTATIFTDYTGLGVNDFQILRRQLKAQGIDYNVAKKTLLNLAVKEAKIAGVDVTKMDGQTAVAFSYSDQVAPAKILALFAKKNKNLKLIAGILDGKLVDANGVLALSKMPNLNEMRAQFVGVLSAPARGFVGVLNANLRNLVSVLDQVKNKKQ